MNPALQRVKGGQGGVVRRPSQPGLGCPRSFWVMSLTCCGTSGPNTLQFWTLEMNKDKLSVPGLGGTTGLRPSLLSGWSSPYWGWGCGEATRTGGKLWGRKDEVVVGSQ